MSAPFTIEIDRRRRLVRLTLVGFWEMSFVGQFVNAVDEAVPRLGCQPGEHDVLVDLSQFAIQTQQVFSACQSFVFHAPNPPRRLALVSGTGLARMQFKRVIDPARNQRIFDSVAEADAWLASG